MGLREEISRDLTAAMKAGEKLRLSTLRMLLSALMYKEKEAGAAAELDDAAVQRVVATLIRQRQDSIEQYRAGGRDELADKEAAEIEILRAYQPPMLDAEEIRAVVERLAGECNASGMKDMGRLMKAVMAELKGKADGRAVNEAVKEFLASCEQ